MDLTGQEMKKISKSQQPFDLEYFRSIRQEISDRIKMHYTLLGTKLFIVGGVFSLLGAGEANGKTSPFLVAAAFSFIFDIVLVENLGWIKRAGLFIKRRFESEGRTSIPWEHEFAQPKGKWTCFEAKSYTLGIWIIGLGLALAELRSIWREIEQRQFTINLYLAGVVILLGIYSCILVWRNLGRRDSGVGISRSSDQASQSNDIPMIAVEEERDDKE
jgi:hypothetical protein